MTQHLNNILPIIHNDLFIDTSFSLFQLDLEMKVLLNTTEAKKKQLIKKLGQLAQTEEENFASSLLKNIKF